MFIVGLNNFYEWRAFDFGNYKVVKYTMTHKSEFLSLLIMISETTKGRVNIYMFWFSSQIFIDTKTVIQNSS